MPARDEATGDCLIQTKGFRKWHSLIIAEQTQHNLLLTGFAISVVTECPEVIVRAFQVGARYVIEE